MIINFLLLLSIISLSASDYHKSVLIPAYKTVAGWNVISEVEPFDVNVFVQEHDSLFVKNRLNLYSPGLIVPTASGKEGAEGFTSIVTNFPAIKREANGFLFGDHIIFNPQYSGITDSYPLKSISFGQGEDAFRMIRVLNELKKNGLLEIDIDGTCLGALRTFNALFALGHPEEYPNAQMFFEAEGINRIDREQILSMIRSMNFNAPLKKPSDIVRALCIEPFTRALPLFVAKKVLGSLGLSSWGIAPMVAFSEEYLNMNGLKDRVALALFESLVASRTAYDTKYPSIDTMMKMMEHYKRDYPLLASLILVKKEDPVVGNWGDREFFEALPVNDDRKAIIPSCVKAGHLNLDTLQKAALAAWKEKMGGSYPNISSHLQLGKFVLGIAAQAEKNPQTFALHKAFFQNQELNDFLKSANNNPKNDVFFDEKIEECIDATVNQFNKLRKACL